MLFLSTSVVVVKNWTGITMAVHIFTFLKNILKKEAKEMQSLLEDSPIKDNCIYCTFKFFCQLKRKGEKRMRVEGALRLV